MKKLFTIALMAVLSMAASAQGAWRVSHRDADPMKGQDERDVYIYDAEGIGSVVVWDWGKADFRLITDNGMFRKWSVAGRTYVPVKVGFFDENGNMEEMISVDFVPEENHSDFICTAERYLFGRKDIRKIMSRMKSGKGYVRFVVRQYDDPDFDLIVTPYNK